MHMQGQYIQMPPNRDYLYKDMYVYFNHSSSLHLASKCWFRENEEDVKQIL